MRALELPGGTVRPEWVDYNGHMNVGYYALAFDQGLDRFLETLDLSQAYVERTGRSIFVLQSRTQFIAEIRSGEPFGFEAVLADWDSRRLHVLLLMRHGVHRTLVASSEQLLLSVDLRTRRSSAWDEATQARLAAHQHGAHGADRGEGPCGAFELPPAVLRELRIRRTLAELAGGT